MTVIRAHRDDRALTLTFVAEFDASVERVWRLWQDRLQLERWWGPPTWPATFEEHEFVVGGRSRYYLTGPEDAKSRGWWRITAIEPPHRLEFHDGFAGEDGEPLASEPPTHTVVTIEEVPAGARMTTVTTFTSIEQLERVVAMGAVDATRLAMDQIDGVLADDRRSPR
jgi:uncharacterized protein YndB with AHSA1/START domain